MDLAELLETFEFLDDWEERYRLLIELGEEMPEFPEAEKTEDNKVKGCLSQVWMIHSVAGERIEFQGDSDSAIVKGLIAVLHLMYSGKEKSAILNFPLEENFKKLGLEEHLSPNRRNGFFAMVERIRSFALS